MQRILILICVCLTAGSLAGCGVFCPPRHEVLIVEQAGQTEQGVSEEIPLVSIPDPETAANTFTTAQVRSYSPRTYVTVGYPASFYAGWSPFWGYRPFLSFGYYHHPFRRHHHYHHRPPHHHRGHGFRPHGGHRPPHHRGPYRK